MIICEVSFIKRLGRIWSYQKINVYPMKFFYEDRDTPSISYIYIYIYILIIKGKIICDELNT